MQLGPGGASAENEFGALWKATGSNRFEYSQYYVLHVWRDKLAMVSP